MDSLDRECRKCGYLLKGLAAQSECPECGNAYNIRSGLGVRISDTAESRGTKLVRRLRTITLLLMTLMVAICSGLLSFFAAHPKKLLITGGIVFALMLILTISSYIFEKKTD